MTTARRLATLLTLSRKYGNSPGGRNLKSGFKLSLIDFGGSLQSSLGYGRQFSKPSELGGRSGFPSLIYPYVLIPS
jgi:hypothetical protein